MKKKLSLLLSLVLVATLFTGCGSSKKTAKGELNIFNWTEYMPPSVIKAFEKKYNIKVNYTTFSSNEEMLSKIKSGKKGMYDLTVASDYMVDTMQKTGVITKLDRSKVPNIKNINPQYLNAYYDKGNKYSVPYMISNAILCYNKKKVPEGITSFSDIFNSKYKKSIVSLDDERMLMGLAAISLGYSVNETDPTKLKKIKEKLISLKPNIKLFDSDTPKTSMINGETSIGYMWCAEAALAMQENKDIVPVYPKEGLCLEFDNFVIPDGAKNKSNAEKFINFILDPKISKMISDVYPYVNPNKAAYPLLPAKYKNNPASNPPAGALSKGQMVKNLGDKAKLYDDVWTEFKNK
jgi:spermidine/putrescine-binding protein